MENRLTVPEQIKVALETRTQKWLSLEIRMTEMDLSKKMKGKLPFTQPEIDRINARLKTNIILVREQFIKLKNEGIKEVA